MQPKVLISNKRAFFDFAIKDTYVAGISLTGTEVKSLRNGKASINEAFCLLDNNEVYLKNANISLFDAGSFNNHEPLRQRKLLLEKREILRLKKAVETKGNTIVPIELFLNEKGLFKLKIGVGTGKKHFDKREDIKKKDHKEEIDRALKKHH